MREKEIRDCAQGFVEEMTKNRGKVRFSRNDQEIVISVFHAPSFYQGVDLVINLLKKKRRR